MLSMLAGLTLSGAVTLAAPPQQASGNLLTNADFEIWDYSNPVWPFQDGIPEVQVAPGWRAFYVDTAPAKAHVPTMWKRPEFRDVKAYEYSYRVHSGMLAQKYFTFGGQHEAGLYQQVGGIAPGTPLRFAVYMHYWSCMPKSTEEWNMCPFEYLSSSPAPNHTKVGIDPTGGTNPWAPTVIWSAELEVPDYWALFSVDAVAQNSVVTVFTYSWADWTDGIFRINNDVYIDDASLVVLSEMPATATPEVTAELTVEGTETEEATPAATQTPAATPTPRPDGAIVHVVQDGDTINAIALAYGVSPDTLKQLNTLDANSFIYVGQELVIALPTPTPTVPPTPVPPTETPQPTPAPTSTPMPPAPTAQPTAMPTPQTDTAEVSAAASPAPSKAPFPYGLIALALALGIGGGYGLSFLRRR